MRYWDRSRNLSKRYEIEELPILKRFSEINNFQFFLFDGDCWFKLSSPFDSTYNAVRFNGWTAVFEQEDFVYYVEVELK